MIAKIVIEEFNLRQAKSFAHWVALMRIQEQRNA
jgi:hypothetical protein